MGKEIIRAFVTTKRYNIHVLLEFVQMWDGTQFNIHFLMQLVHG